MLLWHESYNMQKKQALRLAQVHGPKVQRATFNAVQYLLQISTLGWIWVCINCPLHRVGGEVKVYASEHVFVDPNVGKGSVDVLSDFVVVRENKPQGPCRKLEPFA